MKYRLEQICCPACGAGIDMDIKGRNAIFCPFCGSQFLVDDGETVKTKNININKRITKDININKRYTDEAEIEKERRIDRQNERAYRESKWEYIMLFIILLICIGGFVFAFYSFDEMDKEEKESIEAGLIQAGQSSDDLKGKNYLVVKEQLDSAGFTNITTIDLDDAGWLSNKEDTIDSVTIGGDGSFDASDFFDPESKVVITYH